MSAILREVIEALVLANGRDRTRLMEVVRGVQEQFCHVSSEAMDLIATSLGVKRVEVEGVVSFYAFYSKEPTGRVAIRVSDCVPCRMKGAHAVAEAFAHEIGVSIGETTADGRFSVSFTPCIGLCDQGPAALINGVPFTHLSPERVPVLVEALQSGSPRSLIPWPEDAGDPLRAVRAMVDSNVIQAGPFLLGDFESGAALRHAVAMSPEAVIAEVKKSRLAGRGGAGFPAGLKWEFARKSAATPRYVFCNADEGEPGTFKDRVLLTERADMVFEGMTIAGYAMSAVEGVLYLRGEYAFMLPHLEAVLAGRREQKLLGKAILGVDGFDYDIRIHLGAGAYICGEESALIESTEGLRGVPRDRPPFPVQEGYLRKPTSVNNVETFASVARVLLSGQEAFNALATKGGSTGTKLLSVSGDCARPGIYEIAWGLPLRDMLEMVGATDTIAVQVGGPSGTLVGPDGFGRAIAYEDLATGGSMIVFGKGRDLLEIASQFMEFFVDESCGWCVPCRVGNVLIQQKLDQIRAGGGTIEDLDRLDQLCTMVKKASRCGLGQTSPNPVVWTLKNFRHLYDALVRPEPRDAFLPSFDFDAALQDAVAAQGRAPLFHD